MNSTIVEVVKSHCGPLKGLRPAGGLTTWIPRDYTNKVGGECQNN